MHSPSPSQLNLIKKPIVWFLDKPHSFHVASFYLKELTLSALKRWFNTKGKCLESKFSWCWFYFFSSFCSVIRFAAIGILFRIFCCALNLSTIDKQWFYNVTLVRWRILIISRFMRQPLRRLTRRTSTIAFCIVWIVIWVWNVFFLARFFFVVTKMIDIFRRAVEANLKYQNSFQELAIAVKNQIICWLFAI